MLGSYLTSGARFSKFFYLFFYKMKSGYECRVVSGVKYENKDENAG